MEITIIGWYGTETIGDRAILAGIIKVLSLYSTSISIRLGSLYPFYTERTLFEDMFFFKKISNNKLSNISIFDSKKPWQLENNIKHSDLVMVGGGPLMDLIEMNMLEYAFFYAKRIHRKTLLFGCGWGPLKDAKYIEKAGRLVELSQYTIFRDNLSRSQCLKLFPQFEDKVSSSIDPAIIACDYFIKNYKVTRSEDYIAINFRDVLLEGNHYAKTNVTHDVFTRIIKTINSQTSLPIKLIPMHPFFIGGDDRVILNNIKEEVDLDNVSVEHEPLSLFETMEKYYHAKICVGMRFHSIVLQTFLNGNNYILDYTDSLTGKIIGFINQLNLNKFYSKKYCSLYEKNNQLNIDLGDNSRYIYSTEVVVEAQNHYLSALSKIDV